MSQEPITIVDYDSEWPEKYGSERKQIQDAIGEYITSVEHIGSTFVPGLGSKPIIDIMVGIEHLEDAEECIDPLNQLGYEYCSEFEDEMLNGATFGRRTPRIIRIIYTWSKKTSDFWERHLLFRDYLRDHANVAKEYEDLKRESAKKHRHNIEGYEKAKSQLTKEIENRAREYYDNR